MKLRTLFIIIGGSIGAVAVCLVALIWALTRDLCGNDLLTEAVSPNGRLKAVVFRRDCGATTGFSTHVSVLNNWDTLANENAGNIYGQDLEDETVAVLWEGDQKLKIMRDPKARVYKSEREIWVLPFFQDVKIKYESGAGR